jgi:hypothetical protein
MIWVLVFRRAGIPRDRYALLVFRLDVLVGRFLANERCPASLTVLPGEGRRVRARGLVGWAFLAGIGPEEIAPFGCWEVLHVVVKPVFKAHSR